MVNNLDELRASTAELSHLLLTEESIDTTLNRVADLAVRAVPGCEAVAVTLMRDGKPVTAVATDDAARVLDSFQYEIRRGPCLDAVTHNRVFALESVHDRSSWPEFAEQAAELGFGSSISFPLTVRNDTFGALNLYSRIEHGFEDPYSREIGSMFADQAGVALANVRTHEASVVLSQQLQEAMTSRAVIEQAKGIIMAHDRCDADTAFAVLRKRSQQENRKLRELAQEMVDHVTGDGQGS